VKCSNRTKEKLEKVFATHVLFKEFRESGVVVNPSWYFKFSASILMKNMNNKTFFNKIQNLNQFAYDCHYVNNFDFILDTSIEE